MARGSRISLLGLYTWDNTIFDNFMIPSSVDKDVLVNNLLMECAELEVLYADSDFMKNAIEQWSKKEIDNWNRIEELFKYNESPLSDIDITETIIHDNVKNESGTDKTTSESLNQVNGWNDGLVDRNKINDINERTPNLTNTDKGERIKTIKGLSSKYLKQDVILKELEFRKLYDIYEVIIDEFKSRFCLLIY